MSAFTKEFTEYLGWCKKKEMRFIFVCTIVQKDGTVGTRERADEGIQVVSYIQANPFTCPPWSALHRDECLCVSLLPSASHPGLTIVRPGLANHHPIPCPTPHRALCFCLGECAQYLSRGTQALHLSLLRLDLAFFLSLTLLFFFFLFFRLIRVP